MIEMVRSGECPNCINDLKNKVVPKNIMVRCMGCESAFDKDSRRRYCIECFLRLCCNDFYSPWGIVFKSYLKYRDYYTIEAMEDIRDCGWRDNGMLDEDLIGILIKLM